MQTIDIEPIERKPAEIISQDYNNQYQVLYQNQFADELEGDDYNALLARSIVLNTLPQKKMLDVYTPENPSQSTEVFDKNLKELYQQRDKSTFDASLSALRKEYNNDHVIMMDQAKEQQGNTYADVVKLSPGYPYNPLYQDPFRKIIEIMYKLRKTPYYKDLPFAQKLQKLLDPKSLFMASKPHLGMEQIDDKTKIKERIQLAKLYQKKADLPPSTNDAYKNQLEKKILNLETKVKRDILQPIKRNVYSISVNEIMSGSTSTTLGKRPNPQNFPQEDKGVVEANNQIPAEQRRKLFEEQLPQIKYQSLRDNQMTPFQGRLLVDYLNAAWMNNENKQQLVFYLPPDLKNIPSLSGKFVLKDPVYILYDNGTLNDFLVSFDNLNNAQALKAKLQSYMITSVNKGWQNAQYADLNKLKNLFIELVIKSVLYIYKVYVQNMSPEFFQLSIADFMDILPGEFEGLRKQVQLNRRILGFNDDEFNPDEIVYPMTEQIDLQEPFQMTSMTQQNEQEEMGLE